MTHQVDTVVAADLELLLDTVVAALEHDRNWAGAGSGQVGRCAGGTGSPRAARRGGAARRLPRRAVARRGGAIRSHGGGGAGGSRRHRRGARPGAGACRAPRDRRGGRRQSPPATPGAGRRPRRRRGPCRAGAGWRLNRRDQTPPVEFPGGKVEVDESAAQRTSPGAWPSAAPGRRPVRPRPASAGRSCLRPAAAGRPRPPRPPQTQQRSQRRACSCATGQAGQPTTTARTWTTTGETSCRSWGSGTRRALELGEPSGVLGPSGDARHRHSTHQGLRCEVRDEGRRGQAARTIELPDGDDGR